MAHATVVTDKKALKDNPSKSSAVRLANPEKELRMRAIMDKAQILLMNLAKAGPARMSPHCSGPDEFPIRHSPV
jgi:hypothetical protein